MLPLKVWILAAMAVLAPKRDHEALGSAIARVASVEAPLFQDDEARTKTAAVLVAIAFRESSLRADAVGDHGDSFCAFQINRTMGGGPRLLVDVDACVRRGLEILRESIRVCPAYPVAWYAQGGAHACSSPRAQRISRDRMAIAGKLAREVRP